MYYIKKLISIVLLFSLYSLMLFLKDNNEIINYNIQIAIEWIFHLSFGLCIGGFLHNDVEININKASNIVIFVVLFLLSIGSYLLTLGLNTLLSYFIKETLFELAPYFQMILGMWLFFSLCHRAGKHSQ